METNVNDKSAHFLAHLSSNMRQSLLTVEAQSLQAPVSQHLDHLRILLAILTEYQLTFVVIILVLSTSPVLTAL
jgi:hypothetical protein